VPGEHPSNGGRLFGHDGQLDPRILRECRPYRSKNSRIHRRPDVYEHAHPGQLAADGVVEGTRGCDDMSAKRSRLTFRYVV